MGTQINVLGVKKWEVGEGSIGHSDWEQNKMT